MKRMLSIIFAVLFSLFLLTPVYAMNSSIELYSIGGGNGSFFISPDGTANISYQHIGDALTDSITITVKLEKKNLIFFWKDIEEWTITSYDIVSSGELEYQLTKSGTYRCTIVYEVTNTDGTTETHEYQKEVEYDPA